MELILDDMIKALKCVASQDTVGDCYADHENFIHMDDEHKRIVCGTGEDLRDYISGKEAIGCPYHQNTYGCCDSYVEPDIDIEDQIIFYYENYSGSIAGAFPMSEIGKTVFLTREEAGMMEKKR